jgi:hypothetical protein
MAHPRGEARWVGREPFDLDDGVLVVVPSLSVPRDELRHLVGVEHYGERMLCVTLLLRRPRLRVVYVTGTPVPDEVVDYHLGLRAGGAGRARFTLVTVGGDPFRPLTDRLLDDAAALARIRAAGADAVEARLLPFTVTAAEERLAAALGAGILGPAAAHASLGGKSAGRRLARQAGVRVVDGVEDLRDEAGAWAAYDALGAPEAVLKLDDSFSGLGNALLGPGRRVRLPEDVSWADFHRRLAARGGVLERLLPAPLTSPSVQVLIRPGCPPEVVSTHDQILSGQVYLGCQFPASAAYRSRIAADARRVAASLARRGVIGHFAIDFLVHGDDVYFGEINLRYGGTTHPYLMAREITGATYDQADGVLRSPAGERCYVASDNIIEPRLVGQSPASVLNTLKPLLYDDGSATGVTLHQLGSVPAYGKFGLCAIAETIPEARHLFAAAVSAVAG